MGNSDFLGEILYESMIVAGRWRIWEGSQVTAKVTQVTGHNFVLISARMGSVNRFFHTLFLFHVISISTSCYHRINYPLVICYSSLKMAIDIVDFPS